MARAGGKEPAKLPDALAAAEGLIVAALVKVLALDYGAARTGVAVSDPTGTLARPLGVVERRGDRRGSRAGRGARPSWRPSCVVVGLPLTLRGERGEQAQETERFVEALRAVVGVPVETLRRAIHDRRWPGRTRATSRRTRGRPRTSSTSYLAWTSSHRA